MDAVVPAAGRGTRLGELTADRPKPLVDVAGRPLIEHVFDALLPAAPDALAVVVGYRGDCIREHVGDSYRGVPVRYVEQPDRLGLADAIGRAAPVVDGNVLVCNGDNVLDRDLAPLAAAHDADATLLVAEVDRERARKTGVVVTDAAGRVERVFEKPTDPPSRLVSAGAFAFSPAVFEACRAIEPSDRGEYEIADAITWLVENGYAVRTRRLDARRVNVNTSADIERAERILRG